MQKGAMRMLHLLDHHDHAVHDVRRARPYAHEDAQHATQFSTRERRRVLLRHMQKSVERARGMVGRERLVQRGEARTARLPRLHRLCMDCRSPRTGEPDADRDHAAQHTVARRGERRDSSYGGVCLQTRRSALADLHLDAGAAVLAVAAGHRVEGLFRVGKEVSVRH